jgi:tetratricopeptide (TPR) repeat protein
MHAENIRNAVLLVVSTEYKGRIGIFSNRYISGAALDGDELAGMEAVIALLSVKSGIYGFRCCLASEASELKHSLAIDIQELLQKRSQAENTYATPADALVEGVSAVKIQVHMSEPLPADAEPLDGLNPLEHIMPTSEPTTEKNNVSSQPATTSASQSAATAQPSIGKETPSTAGSHLSLGEILKPALPASPLVAQNTVGNLKDYQKQVKEELENVHRKLVSSDELPTVGTAGHERILEDLRLFNDMLIAEQMRAASWQTGSSQTTDSIQDKSVEAQSTSDEVFTDEDLVTLAQTHRNLSRLSASQSQSSLTTATLPVFEQGKDKPPAPLRSNRIAALICVLVLAGLVWLGYWAYAWSECHKHMSLGIKLLSKNRPLQALPHFIYAAEITPDYSRAYLYLGIALSEVGDYNQSLDAIGRALQLGEPRSKALLARACVLGKMHIYDKAIEDCSNALFDQAGNIETLAVRSANRFRCDQFSQADEDTKAVCDNTRSWDLRARLYRERAAAELRLHEWSKAVEDLEKVVDTFPGSRIYTMLGDAFRNDGKFQEAILNYTSALKVDPRSYQALLGRAISAFKLHQNDEALVDLNSAIAVNAHGDEALLLRGSIYLEATHFDKAYDDLKRAVDLNPYNREAEEKFDVACKRLHKDTASPGTSGVAPDAVASAASDVVKNGDPVALFNMGSKHLANGEIGDAVVCYAQVVRRQPDNADARKYLASALYQQGDVRDATTQLKALSMLRALDAKETIFLSDCLADTGHVDEAESKLKSFLSDQPDNLEVLAGLARIYVNHGLTRQGIATANDGLSKVHNPAEKAMFEALLKQAANSAASHEQ